MLTDPGFTQDQARALGDWVADQGRNVTDIFITHGHGGRLVLTRGLSPDSGDAVSPAGA